MENWKLNYLKSEVCEEFKRQGVSFNEKMVGEVIESILKNYNIDKLKGSDFDNFIDSDAIFCTIDEMTRGDN